MSEKKERKKEKKNIYCGSRLPHAQLTSTNPAPRRRADIYTIHAIGQDEFEDVKVPEAPRQPASSNGK
ncbi:hypothetical protein DL766_009842 [Monosporascus sp. MC13-8B]|uniref:Uncharacterized protein n=1 Tax=Monosporascus cannonballus TaxID=155416 RepID=A0ABY0H0Z7_9PEZI|nr:hypothetical protein DL762_006840 [Monosporascus cannonballus]RYP13520.1 hypothetical protein DL766_009842 [Monosporascus sp. MC13-8B]